MSSLLAIAGVREPLLGFAMPRRLTLVVVLV